MACSCHTGASLYGQGGYGCFGTARMIGIGSTDNQRRVVAAESKRIGKHGLNRFSARPHYRIQLQLRVRPAAAGVGGYQLLVDTDSGDDRINGTGGGQAVSAGALDR